LLDDLETETVFLAGRADELEARAEAAESGLEIAKDMYTRLNADFDNFRKRSVRDLPQHVSLRRSHCSHGVPWRFLVHSMEDDRKMGQGWAVASAKAVGNFSQ
jgi:hypothetical protein